MMKNYKNDPKTRTVMRSKAADHQRAAAPNGEATGGKQSIADPSEGVAPAREPVDHARDELLAVLAHELRTPLSAILAWTRMLIRGGLDEDTYARAIDSIDRNARLQARLLDDILEWSRILRGKIQLKKRPVDLHAIINSAIETLRPAADAKGIKFVIEGMSHSEYVDGDSD